MTFELLIPRRPLSLQAKNKNLQQWKVFVRSEAEKIWTEPTIQTGGLHVTIVDLCGEAPPDVDSPRRPMVGTFDLTSCCYLASPLGPSAFI